MLAVFPKECVTDGNTLVKNIVKHLQMQDCLLYSVAVCRSMNQVPPRDEIDDLEAWKYLDMIILYHALGIGQFN